MTEPTTDTINEGAQFGVGSVLGKSFSIFFRNIVAFGLVSVIVYIPLFALGIFGGEDPSLQVVSLILHFLLSFVITGTLVYGSIMDLRGQRAGIGACLSRGLASVFPVIGVAIIVALGTGLASILLIIPGIILMVMWYVAIPATVIERPGVFAALSRSSQLTKGHRWSVFGIFFIVMVIIYGVSFLVTIAFGVSIVAMDPMATEGPGITFVIVNILLQALTSAFMAVTSAVIYHDLRIEKDGIDVEQIARVFD